MRIIKSSKQGSLQSGSVLLKSAIAVAVTNSLISIGAVNAANIVVNSNSDTSAIGDGLCTLREAVVSANIDAASNSGCVNGAGSDNISFTAAANSITLTQGSRINISSDVTIQGNEINQTIISGGFNQAILRSSGDVVTLRDLELHDASTSLESGGAISHEGGVLNVDGVLLRNNVVAGESSALSGGAIFSRLNASELNISNSQILNNTSDQFGGGIAVQTFGEPRRLTITSSTISGNSAERRAGIFIQGASATISNSTISNNSSSSFGGGVSTSSDTTKVELINSTVVGNSATGGRSGLYARFGSQITVVNSIVSGNVDNGTGTLTSPISASDGTITLRNSVLGDSTLSSAQLSYGSVSIEASNINATSDNENLALEDIIIANSRSVAYADGFLLPAGSRALDTGDTSVCASTPVSNLDSRGLPRDEDAGCDIGAVEMRTASILVNSKADTSGGAECTLRDAFISVNSLTSSGGCGLAGDTTSINFDASVFPSSANNSISLTDTLYLENTYSVTINGRGNPGVTLEGSNLNDADRSIDLNGSQASLTNLAVVNGGGISSENSLINISDSTISGNSNGFNYGGGLYLGVSSIGTVNRSLIANNTARSAGGGIDVYSDSTLILRNSTVSGNVVPLNDNDYGGGGGISLEFGQNQAIIENSTISGNIARTSGGGVYVYDDNQDLTINNSIIAGNSASGGLGHELSALGANNTLAFNTNLFGTSAFDTATAVQTFNTIDPSNVFASSDGLNLSLAQIIEPLGSNGGRTRTHALPAMSPALNIGDNSVCLNTDQRGENRVDGECDLGAFELINDEACFVVPTQNGSVVTFCL